MRPFRPDEGREDLSAYGSAGGTRGDTERCGAIRKEKRGLEDKLESTEKVLREITKHNDKYRQRMDRMQIEMDRLVLELKKTKIDLALAEERKAENELSLKHEIKYLIEKLMNERHKRLQAAAVGSGSRSMNRNASDYGFGGSSNNVSGVAGCGIGSPYSRGDIYDTLQKSEYHGVACGEDEEEEDEI